MIYSLPFGIANVMQRAQPLSEEEGVWRREERLYLKWPCACLAPDFEYKGSDWGYLPSGTMVALDYALPRDCDRPEIATARVQNRCHPNHQ